MKNFVRWTLQNWFLVVFLYCVVLRLLNLIVESCEGMVEVIRRAIGNF